MTGSPFGSPQRLTPRYLSGFPRLQRSLVMGIVNVTPDSFSDGGNYATVEKAVSHGLALHECGADIIDIGGESTRPGATRPLVEDELARVIPVIRRLAEAGLAISVDTMRAEVAAEAIAAGATMVNDVSGGLADPGILTATAQGGAAYVAMHWRGHSDVMQQHASYEDVVSEVRDELGERVAAALAAGIALDSIAIDPGLGFAKTAEHNWDLLAHLDVLDELGLPILLGSSRKSFLGSLLRDPQGHPRPITQRDDANAALTAIAALCGVWCVRVHSAQASRDAVSVAERWLGHKAAGQGLGEPQG